MDKIFYIIYNSYYKHGNYKKDIPIVTVGGLVLFGLFSIFVAIFMLIYWIQTPYAKFPHANRFFMLFCTVLFGTITYYLFFYNERYLKIYDKYKSNVFLNSFTAKFFGFSILIIIYLIPFIICFARNLIVLGSWL